MAAWGLDTSVIVRFLAGTPEPQAETARKRVAQALQDGHELVVSDVAVVEAYYVLHKLYGVPKKAAIAALLNLFRQPGFRSEASGVAVAALKSAAESPAQKPGMVDRLLHAGYRRECGHVLTFDKAVGKLDHVEVLE